MSFFAVGDGAHSHPKIRKILATEPAALALWTAAGSWSADELTEGFIADDQLPWLMPADPVKLARALVSVGLWERVRGGYRFHEWTADGDGTPRNPTKAEILARRSKRSSAGRFANHRRWHVARDLVDPSCTFCPDSGRSESDPNRIAKGIRNSSHGPGPGPVKGGDHLGGGRHVGNARASERPPDKCQRHRDDPEPPPCGPCKDTRLAAERWDAGAADRQREAAAAARKCRFCDGDGWRYHPDGRHLGVLGVRCNHEVDQEA